MSKKHPCPPESRLEAFGSITSPEDTQADERAMAREVLRLRDVIKTGGAMYRLERAALGIAGGHDPNQAYPRWGVFVKEVAPGHYRAVFRVGAQYFTLANEEGDEALSHVTFIRDMFVVALQNLGIRIDTASPEDV